MKVIRVGTLIDGTGSEPRRDVTVFIQGDKIFDIGTGSSAQIPTDATIVDARDLTVLPGLVDAHLHLIGHRTFNPYERLADPQMLMILRSAADLQLLLSSGFTSVRDCGSSEGIYLKRAVEEGTLVGPRIRTSHKIITQTAGHGDIHYVPIEWAKQIGSAVIADGVDECRRAARANIREGADFLKICTTGGGGSQKDSSASSQFTLDEIRAITEEAHRVGIKVASHAQGLDGIRNAILGGVDTIEHGTYIDDETCELMVKRGLILVRTLLLVHQILKEGPKHGVSEWAYRKATQNRDARIQNFQRALKWGVRIANGSDTSGALPCKHGMNAVQLELLVEAGMSPTQAIVASTKTAAEAMTMQDQIGTVEKGKFADLIAVAGDPIADIKIFQDLKRMPLVMKGGEVAANRGIKISS